MIDLSELLKLLTQRQQYSQPLNKQSFVGAGWQSALRPSVYPGMSKQAYAPPGATDQTALREAIPGIFGSSLPSPGYGSTPSYLSSGYGSAPSPTPVPDWRAVGHFGTRRSGVSPTIFNNLSTAPTPPKASIGDYRPGKGPQYAGNSPW